MDRSAYHHGHLPDALIAAATRLLDEPGAAAFSLREVARRVGVSPSAAYRHYADRDALLGAVAAAGFVSLSAAMRADRGADPADWFMATGRAYVRHARAHPARFALMFGGVRAPAGDAWAVLTEALDGLDLPAQTRPGAELVAWSAVHGLARLLIDGAIPAEGADAAIERVLYGVLRALR